jgi:glycosyltransferase involved in cell wall biosynthesis
VTALRVAICSDFPEERWPSMDRVASMLIDQLERHHSEAFEPARVCPPFRRAGTRLPLVGRSRLAFNGDRFLNRFRLYPAHVGSLAPRYDLFHIVDHSYAHLAHALPAARTVVTCHDLDAFRSVLAPGEERRSEAFRAMSRRILTGLQRAACVTCDTTAIRDELWACGLVGEDRLVVAPLGVDEGFFVPGDRTADGAAARLVPLPAGAVEVLHVGTTAPRKRVDVLLRVCGVLARDIPELRLTRVGEPLTVDQQRLVRETGLVDRLLAVNDVDEPTLAALYRRAALLMQPSEREGFGLPVIEALASGTPVVASDLPVLREVGGAAAEYCPVADIGAWRRTAAALIRERREAPARWNARRELGRQHARRFTWRRFASDVADVYRQVAAQSGLGSEVEGHERWPAHA